MSQELSRVKSRKNKVVEKQPGKSKKNTKTTVKVVKQSKSTGSASHSKSTGSASHSKSTKSASSSLTRKGRQNSTNKSSTKISKGQNNETSATRSETYSSDRVRLSKMFVNSLIFIFVILLIVLLLWGIEGAPPLSTLW